MPASPWTKRRWYQISLRTLMLLMGLACVGFACYTPLANARQRRLAREKISKYSVLIYDYQLPRFDLAKGVQWNKDAELPRPVWLRKLLGDDFFVNVVGAQLSVREFMSNGRLNGYQPFSEMRYLCVDLRGMDSSTGWMEFFASIIGGGSNYYIPADQTTGTIRILENLAPTAYADYYTTSINVPLNIAVETGVLSNDTDPESDPLTVAVDQQPTYGSLTLNANGSLVYTPNTDFGGVDTFTYIVSDGHGNTAIGTVTITVGTLVDGYWHDEGSWLGGCEHENGYWQNGHFHDNGTWVGGFEHDLGTWVNGFVHDVGYWTPGFWH